MTVWAEVVRTVVDCVELDVADKVAVAAPTKKIITYTNVVEPPENLAAIYAQAVAKKPDVVKLVMPARTPEEAWPLVQVLGKPAVPTVVLGLGRSGVMLSILARRVGVPGSMPAPRHGLEADHALATIADLETIYHYRDIGKGTRFVGVTGFGTPARLHIALINAALKDASQRLRCLPLAVGRFLCFARFWKQSKSTMSWSMMSTRRSSGPWPRSLMRWLRRAELSIGCS